MLIYAEHVLLPDKDALTPATIEVDGPNIAAITPGSISRVALSRVDRHIEGILSPGFVDVHCHGGGGSTFVTDDIEEVKQVIAAHRQNGTTSIIASLVSDSPDGIVKKLSILSPLVKTGELCGVHLEGPWISPDYRGAHDPAVLTDPSVAVLDEFVDAGAVALLTIAPELPGAEDTIHEATRRGVVCALGHTAATLQQARSALSWGVTGATHLFNAMPDMRHRAPGPVLACLENDAVWLELIADGTHVDSGLVAWLVRQYPERVVLITDAMGAACAEDGEYMLGSLPVTVTNGVALISGTSTIAGSTLTLQRAVKNVVAQGIDVVTALRLATEHPAQYLHRNDIGQLRAGRFADLVVLNDDMDVKNVMYHGEWI